MTLTSAREPYVDEFVHEAAFYEGIEGFVATNVEFVQAGLARSEAVLVATDAARIEALRSALGPAHEDVHFAEMARVGRNPGRIIAVWRDFLDRNSDRPVRGIGEPVWPGRHPDELVECQHHEHLLNHAFASARGFWLRCPYDTTVLDTEVLVEATRSHPRCLGEPGTYLQPFQPANARAILGAALSAPIEPVRTWMVYVTNLADVRHELGARAVDAGFDRERVADIVLVAAELLANGLQHGSGQVSLNVWREADRLTVEVVDGGFFDDPLAGRARPRPDTASGRGLWIVHELADLVQLRSDGRGTFVRASFVLGAT